MTDTRGIETLGPVDFIGHPGDGKNLSGAGLVGEILVVAGDEDDRVQLLRRAGDHYELLRGREILLNDSGQEADIEGIACEGYTVHVLGSHSCTRSKPKPAASREENRERMESIQPPSPFRSILARFRLASDGGHSDLAMTTLRSVLAGKTILQPFAQVPCKENGVDIEGLAVRDGLLRVGFRGPVFQHGFVPVLTCTFANPVTAADILYLNLGGRGIRDLERVEGGFLVLAGPVSDAPVSFQLYFWDGIDCVPGGTAATAPGGPDPLVLLGEVPTPPGAKAEGLAVEAESKHHYTALILFDGLKDGGALRVKIPRPIAGA